MRALGCSDASGCCHGSCTHVWNYAQAIPHLFPALERTKSDRTGEIQLTNGLRELVKSRPIYACEVRGTRHDTGNKLGFLKAVVYFALRRPDLADKFTTYLCSLDLQLPAGKR